MPEGERAIVPQELLEGPKDAVPRLDTVCARSDRDYGSQELRVNQELQRVEHIGVAWVPMLWNPLVGRLKTFRQRGSRPICGKISIRTGRPFL